MKMSSDSSSPHVRVEKAQIPIAWFVIVIVFAITSTVTVMGKLNAIENAIASQRVAIAQIQSGDADRWTATNQDRWIDKTRLKNPTLNLPDIEEIKGYSR